MTVTNHLRRHLAPISEAAWAAIDGEADRALRHYLAARQVVDFEGPHGWGHSSNDLGHIDRIDGPVEGVEAAMRVVQPLAELRTPFSVDLAQLDDLDRGRRDPDLDRVVQAARRAASAEDTAVFHGFKQGGITGMSDATPHRNLTLPDDFSQYPKVVAQALDVLRAAGVDGPFAIALGPRCYTGVIESTEFGGYPVLEHIRLLLAGPVIWAPAVDGAVVLSLRGGDFVLSCGQDFAIGYAGNDISTVQLYLEESIAFQARSPEAAVWLRFA